jgi:zinc protease
MQTKWRMSMRKYLFLFTFLFWGGFAHAILPIQHWQTKSGARVLFVENHALPMLDLSIEFPAGSGYDSAAKAGVASMTNRIMRLGSEGMDEDEIARRSGDIGAVLSGRFDADRAGLALRTLSAPAEREAALELFARVLQKPVFPAKPLERERVRLVSAIKESDIVPGAIAGREFYKRLYPQHPYGLRSSGEIDSVGKITRDDLVAFYRGHYQARNAVIALLGDVSRTEAEAIVERITAALPEGGANPVMAAANVLSASATRLIPHHAAQSHILVGNVGISRGDADYFPLFVGNYILGGGGFVSRILTQIRQKRGLAYSAYSYFSPRQERGPFVIGMQTRKDQAKPAVDVLMKTLRDYIAEGPTEKELDAAKKNIIGGFPLRIDSNRKLHTYLAAIGFYRLPLTYLNEFNANVERVTTADIKRAFANHVDPDKLVTVVVGAEEAAEASAPAR